MKKNLLLFACVAAALVSCNKVVEESSSLVKLSFNVVREIPGQDTKAALSGSSVVFNANDEISVFDDVSNKKFTTAAGGARATFTGEAENAESYLILSPYDENASRVAPGSMRVNYTIPSVQVATPGGVDPKALVSAGLVSAGGDVTLYNAVALVQVVVPDGIAVKQIQLGGGRGSTVGICGKFEFNVDNQTITPVAMSNIITLVPASGNETIAPGTYYIAVRPKPDYDAGLVLAYVTTDNVLHKRTTRSDAGVIYIYRSHIVPLGTLGAGFTAMTGTATLRYADAYPQFTGLLKKMAGGSGGYADTDNVIKKVVFRSHSLYPQTYKSGDNVISNGPNSTVQIHAWVIDDTAYVYTEAPKITLYSNSANLFRDFAALEEVSFDDVNTMDGTSFEYMFRNCVNLKSVDFGNADFSKVTNFSYMFVTNKLESVNFHETATTAATTMQSMFSQALNLRNLYLGPNFTLAPTTTGMFNGTASSTTATYGIQCKLYASQSLYDALNVDLNGDGVNPTTLFNTWRFYFTPVD